LDPRRFTYTPLILCKGMKPLSIWSFGKWSSPVKRYTKSFTDSISPTNWFSPRLLITPWEDDQAIFSVRLHSWWWDNQESSW
jgi:hypothetical protein